jgi:maleylpyruvate isomerase
MSLILHAYWRSGTSYRTRIGLNLKGVAYETIPVDLRSGEHLGEVFRALNPQGLAPVLEADDVMLTQSSAILEWLEERYPEPALLPPRLADRATVRAMAAIVACDIHPLQNLRVLKQLRSQFSATPDDEAAWIRGWITSGFEALEVMIHRHGRGFSFGDHPTLADCHLVPQVYAAHRFGVNMSSFPSIRAVVDAMHALPAVVDAHPDQQPDADATVS